MPTSLERYDECIEMQRAGDMTAAVEGLKALVQDVPDFALAYNALAAFHKQQGQLPEAVACAEKYTELEPEDSFGFTVLSSFCIEAGEREKAEDALGMAQTLQFKEHLQGQQ